MKTVKCYTTHKNCNGPDCSIEPAPASPSHTATPWNVERPFQEPGVYIAGPNTSLIAKLYQPDARLYNGDKLVSIDGNAARIVACVNACAGMTDPAQEIAALRARSNNVPAMCAEVEKQRAEIKALRDALERCAWVISECSVGKDKLADLFSIRLAQARAALSAFGGEAGK